MSNEYLAFWHQHLGQHLSTAPIEQSSKVQLPTRMKKGVGPNTLGAGIDATYIVTPGKAILVGLIERESTEHVTFVPSDGDNAISGTRYIARWLTSQDKVPMPFMIGVIGKSNPNASFMISHSPARCFYCKSGGGFSFNLDTVITAKKLIGDLPWKTVAAAIHQAEKYRLAHAGTDTDLTRREQDKMSKIIQKTPAIKVILSKINVRPRSGEYQILSWLGE